MVNFRINHIALALTMSQDDLAKLIESRNVIAVELISVKTDVHCME
jgi:hypothetical protein